MAKTSNTPKGWSPKHKKPSMASQYDALEEQRLIRKKGTNVYKGKNTKDKNK
jgi:hypothetical protein